MIASRYPLAFVLSAALCAALWLPTLAAPSAQASTIAIPAIV